MDEEQVRRQAISASPSAKPYDNKTASSTESPWSSHARDAIPRVATVSPPKAAAIAAPASASTAALPNPPRTEPSPVAHSAIPNAISVIARTAASPPIRAIARITVDLSGPIHQNLSDGFAGRTTAGQAHELLSAATDELEHAGQSLGSRSSRHENVVSDVDGLSGCPLADVAFEIVAKKYREIRSALSVAGWEVVRQRGSHEVWAKPGENARIVVAGKDSDTVPVGTLSSIRRASGLEHLR